MPDDTRGPEVKRTSPPFGPLQRMASQLPLPVALGLMRALNRPYGALVRATRFRVPPRDLARYLGLRRALFGADVPPADAPRALDERMLYVLSYWLITSRIDTASVAVALPLVASAEIRGREHLEAALAGGRGVVAVSAHLGYPHLIRAFLRGLGVDAVASAHEDRHAGQIRSTGDVWARARGAQQLRAALADGRVSVMLADGPAAAPVRLPFFRQHVDVATGPFHLASRAAAPVVPFFVTAGPGRRRFRLDIEPPIAPCGDAPLRAAEEFIRLYATYAERHASQIQFAFIGQPRSCPGAGP